MLRNNKMSPPREAITRLYTQLKDIVGDATVDRENIVGIALALMQLVEEYPDIKGPQKKDLVLHVLKLFIKDTIPDQSEAELVTSVVELTLPTVIDTIVSVDKKELKIKLRKGCRKLLACCGCD
jgi:hypothetical protein